MGSSEDLRYASSEGMGRVVGVGMHEISTD